MKTESDVNLLLKVPGFRVKKYLEVVLLTEV
jgi:hypothetical protein